MSIEILKDGDAVALRVADLFALAAQESAAARPRFAVALSGGETPRALYKLLARQQFSQKVPWRRTHLYWGDERCVPPDDPRSNYGMARDAFIKHVPIAPENVHRMRGEDLPEEAAHEYDAELRRLAAAGAAARGRAGLRPRPARPRQRRPHGLALPAQRGADRRGRARACRPSAPDGSPRLTVTAPVINAARRVWFLVSGAGKAGMVAEVIEGLRVPMAVPAQGVAPVHGSLTWFLDEAAAASSVRTRAREPQAGGVRVRCECCGSASRLSCCMTTYH